MRFGYVILGAILAIAGYACSVFTSVRIDWQTTKVLPFWEVNVPVPVFYQPFALLTIPLYAIATISILYGLFSNRGSQK